MRVFSAYLLGLAVTGAPLHAQTAMETAALAVAVEVCSDPAPDTQSVATAITAGGWTPDDNGATVRTAMFSALFHMQYSSASAEALDYAQQNADFMTASILGNSALPENQPGYTAENLKLGTFGMTSDTPYCILAGPAWLYDSLATSANMAATNDQPERVISDPAKSVMTGTLEDATLWLMRLDLTEVDAAYAAKDLSDATGLRATMEQATLLIQPKARVLQ